MIFFYDSGRGNYDKINDEFKKLSNRCNTKEEALKASLEKWEIIADIIKKHTIDRDDNLNWTEINYCECAMCNFHESLYEELDEEEEDYCDECNLFENGDCCNGLFMNFISSRSYEDATKMVEYIRKVYEEGKC